MKRLIALDLVLTLRYTISDMPTSGLRDTVHIPLVPVFQPIFNPIHCPLTTNPYMVSLCILLLWGIVSKALIKPKQAKSTTFPHPPSQLLHYRRLSGSLKHNFLFINQCILFLSLLLVLGVWRNFGEGFCPPPS